MGVYLYRTENVSVWPDGITYTHGLGVAPTAENGEVFIRHRTGTYGATVLRSNSQVVCLASLSTPAHGEVTVDLCVMAFHSIIK